MGTTFRIHRLILACFKSHLAVAVLQAIHSLCLVMDKCYILTVYMCCLVRKNMSSLGNYIQVHFGSFGPGLLYMPPRDRSPLWYYRPSTPPPFWCTVAWVACVLHYIHFGSLYLEEALHSIHFGSLYLEETCFGQDCSCWMNVGI